MTFTPDPVNLAQLLSLETLSQHVWGTGQRPERAVFNSDTLGSRWQKMLIRLKSYLIPEHLEIRQIPPCGFSDEVEVGVLPGGLKMYTLDFLLRLAINV